MRLPVRQAVEGDADAILDIETRGGREAWTEARIRDCLNHPCGEAWVIERDGEVVGHVLALLVGGEAEILTIAVDPAHRRSGVGSTLLQSVLTAWRARGSTRTVLEVRIDNAPANALYRRLGFEEVGQRRAYYADGTDALILAKDESPDRP